MSCSPYFLLYFRRPKKKLNFQVVSEEPWKPFGPERFVSQLLYFEQCQVCHQEAAAAAAVDISFEDDSADRRFLSMPGKRWRGSSLNGG